MMLQSLHMRPCLQNHVTPPATYRTRLQQALPHTVNAREQRCRFSCPHRRFLKAHAASNSSEEAAQAPEQALPVQNEQLAAILAETQAEVDEGTFDSEKLGFKLQELLLADSGPTESLKAELEKQKSIAQDKYLRLNADFDNFRRRSGAERERQGDQVRGDVVKSLIPLIDSFEAAQNSVKAETEGEEKISSAYQGLYKQMVETFKALGVEAVPGVGEPFDPEYHDAIMREPNDDVPDGTILQEFRRGFKLGKTLLRAGMVKVSFSEPAAEPAAQPEEETIDV